jgi:hypothetical protein
MIADPGLGFGHSDAFDLFNRLFRHGRIVLDLLPAGNGMAPTDRSLLASGSLTRGARTWQMTLAQQFVSTGLSRANTVAREGKSRGLDGR